MKIVKTNNIKPNPDYQLRFYIKGLNKYFVLGHLNIGFVCLYGNINFYDKKWEVFYNKEYFFIMSIND